MGDITFPNYASPIRRLHKVASIAALLAVALVAASVKVEECRIVPGAFSNGFSSGFDVSRRVCGRSTVAYVLASKVRNAN